MTALPAAVLLDLDGTVADTEHLWIAAKDAVAARHGIPWSAEDGAAAIGLPTLDYSAEFVRRGANGGVHAIAAEITALVAEGVRSGPRWRPGARELLVALREAGVPMALVTMAYRPVAEAVAAAAGVFDVIIARDDVEESKPHPEPYLRALAALGADAAQCIAVEDTDTGARSAEAAGIRTLFVSEEPASVDRPRRLTLAGVGPADLGALLG